MNLILTKKEKIGSQEKEREYDWKRYGVTVTTVEGLDGGDYRLVGATFTARHQPLTIESKRSLSDSQDRKTTSTEIGRISCFDDTVADAASRIE